MDGGFLPRFICKRIIYYLNNKEIVYIIFYDINYNPYLCIPVDTQNAPATVHPKRCR